jgi:hypothetical protein
VNLPQRRQQAAELVREAAAEQIAFFSPVNHIHPGCPPTLLLMDQGPSVPVEFSDTVLGFDLVFTNYSPAAY